MSPGSCSNLGEVCRLSESHPPYIDLHTHLRGTITPDIARRLATKHGLVLGSELFASASSFAWRGFPGFLQTYAAIGNAVKDAEDLYFLTEQWLVASARDGTIYSEVMLSPAHIEQNGIPLPDQLAAVQAGIDAARGQSGIEARVVATCIRHHGPGEAENLVRRLERLSNPIVVGFGLTGDEHKFEPSDFARAFAIAADIGLGCTAHAGEWRGADSVAEAVRQLRLKRIGHGVRAIDDRDVLASLVENNVGWEICLSSNLRLKYNAQPSQHPLRVLIDAGCRIAFGTDDPGFFDTTTQKEYSLAEREFGLTSADLFKVSSDAIDMAFCDPDTKIRLRRTLLSKSDANETKPS